MEIHSVQDYITLLEKLKELYTYDEPIAGSPTFGTQIHIPEFIYRGHGRKSYKLLPGILRTKICQRERRLQNMHRWSIIS